MRAHRGRFAAMAGVVALVTALTATACGDGDDDSGGGGGGTTTLTINTFGTFGYKEAGLYAAFEAAHPGVKIVENVAEYNDHHNNLVQHLAAGSGAADVEGVDEGFMAQFIATPDQFVNLLDHGAGAREADYAKFKWSGALSADGKSLIGLGTDVGGLAMCYRVDLFEKAGLPTAPDQVGALWPTWDQYFATGLKFRDANTGATFFDAGTNVYNAQVFQLAESYYKPGTEDLQVGTNPGVRAAFDTTAKAIQDGLSGKMVAFTDDWSNALKNGTFATLTCPAWMVGYLKTNAPDTAGKWNMTSVPGSGGNWGGSWLVVPSQSKNKDLAAELVDFLTLPENQIKVFKAIGNMPSTVEAINDPSVQSFTEPFLNDAPTGKIFGESALELTPQFQGPKHGPIRQAIEHGIQAIEQENTDPAKAWEDALAEAERAAR
ncbi:extracellular solute-binding protein [Frankia sp. CNm7]|uniref:Extracellular solute-binding protein n=1 Tax=Frankia nepalensis TaxID=1836974 RepID=A0A937RKP4_9ACTN|nr:extracellular solute-binding protein [Frankia nepalensis]MBL7497283.1 extracellular solute-binding protein [Frankia nepalensis]MBL7512142.1 extracellular solute-binding protein [Frankia nepalensis]MBL7520367.1 extracellular solute-binding protein [Frankia nepalensis]MBL7631912.1 extracellular solute-binding protein [Frankia nepalensis]